MADLSILQNQSDTRIRIARDTQRRLISGVLSYPIIWVFIGIGSHLHVLKPDLFWQTTAVFCLTTVIRVYHMRALDRFLPDRLDTWTNLIPILMIPHSLVWGCLFAYSLNQGNSEFQLFMTFGTAGLVPGGINNFATNLRVGLLFVACMLLPGIFYSSLVTGYWFLALLLMVYLVFVVDVARRQTREYSQMLSNELELAKLSRTDTLTQLDNRRYFDEKLNELCHLTSRNHEKLTVAIVDCDFFKCINDSHGHDVGDECLKHLARLLTEALPRTTDVCARLGGEEFSLILPGTDLAGAKIVAERIRKKIETTPLVLNKLTLSMTVSIGSVSRVVEKFEPDLPDQLFKQADLALYSAKETGRNRCVYAYYDTKTKTYVLEDSGETTVPPPTQL